MTDRGLFDADPPRRDVSGNRLAFYCGMHHPHAARFVRMACISINALRRRRSGFEPPREGWIMDSGAFTTISTYGRYLSDPGEYAIEARRWVNDVAGLKAIVAQDYMCEPFILTKTGLSVPEHQRLTIERYDDLVGCWDSDVPIMPVLQGFMPEDYVAHLRAYGPRLRAGMWVGVGSVCKRQGDPKYIRHVLAAILAERPDLRLHGFGVKLTALASPRVRDLLHSADSMAWSFAARREGRNANDPQEAIAFERRVDELVGRLQ